MEVSERQEELLQDQACSLARMADTWEKSVGSVMKFADMMELFACGDHYVWIWEMGRSGNEQEVLLKSFWKDRSKEAKSGDGSGSGLGGVRARKCRGHSAVDRK